MYAIVVFLLAVIVAAAAAVVFFISSVGRDNFNKNSVRGKRVLITGGSSGIGRQLAYEYSRLGARVVVTARREKELKEVVAKCRQLGAQQAEYVAVDFAKPEDRERVVNETEALLGGLDQLILNHVIYRYGFWVGSDKNLADLQSDLNVNFVAYADIAFRSFAPLSKSSGSIGVISSIDAKFSVPKGGTHSVSKAALEGFFGTLNHDLRLRETGISVTICVLGPIATYYKREEVSYFGMCAGAVDETAMAIIKGVTSRAREIYHPASVSLALFFHRFFPSWVENYSISSFVDLLPE